MPLTQDERMLFLSLETDHGDPASLLTTSGHDSVNGLQEGTRDEDNRSMAVL